MSDAFIDNKRYFAPDLTTHFRVLEGNACPRPVAQILQEKDNGPSKLVGSYQIATNRPESEIVQDLVNFVTRHGFQLAPEPAHA